MLFLSYRRSDCLAASNALRLALVRRYGVRAVFRDYEHLEAGQPWPDQLRDGVAGAAVVLALIGKGWDIPRLDDTADWVRIEVEAGVTAKKLIPLLVDGASMPAARWPGSPLNELPTVQALKLRNTDDFEADVARLCAVLEQRHPAFAELEKLWRGRFQLPPVTANFVGRETEIEQLKTALLNGGRAGVSALRGMGGVGKTTLAVKVATELIHDFPDGVFTLSLQGTTTPRSAVELMREVVRIYRPTAQAADEADAPRLFREVLTEQRVLILLDNAGSTAQVKPLLTAAPPTVGFLITSRNTLKFDNLTLLELHALPMADAVKLLREVARRGTDADLEAVAKLCGRLPLALRVAAVFLRDNDHWTVAKYVAELDAHRLERLADEDDAERDVRTVLAFSLDLLAIQKPEVAARYALLSVFPADFDDAAAQAVLDLGDTTWLDTATVLRDRSLLDFEKDRYRVHDLLRLVASRDREGAASTHAAELRFATHYAGVQRECERLYDAGHDNVVAGLRLFDIEAGNIAHGRAWCLRRAGEPRPPGSGPNTIATLIARYALNAQLVHDMRLSPHDLKVLLDAALPVMAASGMTVAWASVNGRIAVLWQGLGNPDEALRLLRETLEPLLAANSEKNRAVHLGWIANILVVRGQLDEALRIHQDEILPVVKQLGDVKGQAVTMGKVADILQARGQLDEALRIRREECVPVYERLGDVRSKAVTMGQVADILRERGQLDEALHMYEEMAAVMKGLGDVRMFAAAQGRVADILQARGQLGQALRIRREEELPVYERLGDVREKAVTMGKVADILQARGQLDEALYIRLEECIPVCERLGDVRTRAVELGYVADILRAGGHLDEALTIYSEELLPVFERLGDVRLMLICRVNIAQYLELRNKAGDRAEAVGHLRWALAEAEKMQLAEVSQIRQILARVEGG